MHLWTKAVILLIVTNSMASRDQSNSLQKAINLRTAKTKCPDQGPLFQMETCMREKWAYNPSKLIGGLFEGFGKMFKTPTIDPEMLKRKCCYDVDYSCVSDTYAKKNCELLSGYEELVQNVKKEAMEGCAKNGVNPDKDCAALKKSVSNSCEEFVCSSAHKVMTQSLALIVVSIVTIFVFF